MMRSVVAISVLISFGIPAVSCPAGVASRIVASTGGETPAGCWAVVTDRQHPERPGKYVRIHAGSEANASGPVCGTNGRVPRPQPLQPLLVRPGSHITLWRDDGEAHVRLAGIAIAGGHLNGEIPVRLILGGSESRVLRGWIRGPGSVELEPLSVAWTKP